MGNESVTLTIDEQSEVLDKLKSEERALRASNEILRKENRVFIKANKGLEGKANDAEKDIKRERGVLKVISDSKKDIESKIYAKELKARKVIKEAERREEELIDVLTNANNEMDRSEDIARQIIAKRAELKSARQALTLERDELERGKVAHAKASEIVDAELAKAQKLVKKNEGIVARSDRELAKLGNELDEIEVIKAKQKDKCEELVRVHTARLALKKDVQKELDGLLAQGEKLKVKEAKLDVIEKQLKGGNKALDRENKELDIRKQEIETLDLRVKKIIREKKIGADLKKLKKGR